jgi:hypothetical protein
LLTFVSLLLFVTFPIRCWWWLYCWYMDYVCLLRCLHSDVVHYSVTLLLHCCCVIVVISVVDCSVLIRCCCCWLLLFVLLLIWCFVLLILFDWLMIDFVVVTHVTLLVMIIGCCDLLDVAWIVVVGCVYILLYVVRLLLLVHVGCLR